MAPKQDRRKERTEKEILNGLIALMQEKSMKNISVRELAERIDINRSTFYLHYTDIYDLIEKQKIDWWNRFYSFFQKRADSRSGNFLIFWNGCLQF